jgi:hypothetical protein
LLAVVEVLTSFVSLITGFVASSALTLPTEMKARAAKAAVKIAMFFFRVFMAVLLLV